MPSGRRDDKPIQIHLYLGFDEESDQALQNAWEAVKELLDEGINVELIPYNIWLTDPTGSELFELPKIVIDDEVISMGHAPDKEEIIFYVRRRYLALEEIEVREATIAQ